MITWKVYCTGIVFAGKYFGNSMYDTRDLNIRHKKRAGIQNEPLRISMGSNRHFFVGILTLDSMGAFDGLFSREVQTDFDEAVGNDVERIEFLGLMIISHWFPLRPKIKPWFSGWVPGREGVGWRPPWCHVWREILVSKSIRTESILWNLRGSLQCHPPQEIIRPY